MTYDIVVGRSKKDLKKFGTEGTILLGKHYVQMGRTVSLSNNVYLDMIRSHVVFVCGKRGGGKCLDGDTLITLNDGSRVPIRDLASDDRDVITLGKDLKIRKSGKDGFYRRTVDKLLRVTLRSGKELKLTPEHPLLTIDGWTPAVALAVGSRIATPRTLPFFGENVLDEATLKLLAYLIAEGHLGHRTILFTNTDERIVDDFTVAASQFANGLRVVPVGKMSYALRGGRPHPLKAYLERLGLYGKNAREKFIPRCVFTTTKANAALFLNRLFSCDGTIFNDKNRDSWRVSYASASRQLITDVQSLLLKFSILSTVRQKRMQLNGKSFFSYELEIHAEHLPAFLQEIGFHGKKFERQVRALQELPVSRNPNTDTIPKELWNRYRPENWAAIGRAAGYAHPKAMRERIHYAPSRQTLLQLAIADQRDDLALLATSDIYWDEIKAVETLSGTFEVFDLTVPGTHNFIANDVIVHNSYTMGVIAEGMADLPAKIRNNLSIIMLDTMGIYWTMKYPNMKDRDLLDQWGFKPHPLDITIFTPEGYFNKYKDEGIPTDRAFSIKPSELQGTDWTATFGVTSNDPVGVLIESIVHAFKEAGNDSYSLNDLIKAIDKNPDSTKDTKNAAKNHFEAAKSWGVFSANGTTLKELAAPGQVTVLDVSCYATEENGWAVKSLVIGLVAQKLFNERMLSRKDEEFKDVERQTSYFSEDETEKQEFPLVWLVVDEAHEFMPNQGKTLATDPLVTILREGRQPGISVILATQQPGKIHTDVMTQSDTIIAHRITAKLDTDALSMLMQSYMRTGLDKELDNLPRTNGAALILDDNNEAMYPIQIRPRFTWHGGESPTAFKKQKELFGF